MGISSSQQGPGQFVRKIGLGVAFHQASIGELQLIHL